MAKIISASKNGFEVTVSIEFYGKEAETITRTLNIQEYKNSSEQFIFIADKFGLNSSHVDLVDQVDLLLQTTLEGN